MMLRTLDLFSGIGGFSLGLERTGGFKTVAFCEIDPFCRRVLAKHWPEVPIHEDVRELTGARLAADGIAVDVICGGFPCQDVSFAGKRAGLEGARSGLWGEYRRIIGEIRPGFVIVENVPGLLSLGLGTVLGDLAALGLDAVWDCVPASAVGAPHRRDRVWLVAHANGQGKHDGAIHAEMGGASQLVADAAGSRQQKHPRRSAGRVHGGDGRFGACGGGDGRDHDWSVEPAVGRVANGVPSRVDRLRSLGNSVVPQIPELIGNAILAANGARE
jgi:DNA (cytosine-5)-methyltransferase 1